MKKGLTKPMNSYLVISEECAPPHKATCVISVHTDEFLSKLKLRTASCKNMRVYKEAVHLQECTLHTCMLVYAYEKIPHSKLTVFHNR